MTYLPDWREPAPSRAAQWVLRVRRHYESMLGCVPASCPLCQGSARGGRLCGGCLVDVTQSMRSAAPRCAVCCLALADDGGCPDCLLRAPAFDRIVAAFDYASPGDVLIRHFKVANRFAYARMLAELLAHAVNAAMPSAPRHTILVPVPASRASINKRGFNPAAELARCLSWQLPLRYRPDLLVRAREGVKQTSLSRVERAQSVQRLYRCAKRVDGAHIAVVDDVATTGSTLHGIAREFKAAGAASVCGLVVARTPYR